MSRIRKQSRGFTLVELLIVVIILGILAAIVIPQFTNASEDARKGTLGSQLQTLRSQVELYKLQHRDAYPTATGAASGAWDWDKLIKKTDATGAVSASGTFGPYLQSESFNTYRATPAKGVAYSSTELTAGDVYSAASTDGWVIMLSGKIYAVSKAGGHIYNENDTTASTNEN